MSQEILLVNLTLEDRDKRPFKRYTLNNQVYTHRKSNILRYSEIKDRRLIRKCKANNDLYVINVEVLKQVGRVNKK